MILMVCMFCCVTAPTWGIDPSWLIFFNGGWFNHKLSKCVNVNRPTCSRSTVCNRLPSSTLPETNGSPLKIDGWKMKFLWGPAYIHSFCQLVLGSVIWAQKLWTTMSNLLGLCILCEIQSVAKPEGLTGFQNVEDNGFQNEIPDFQGLLFQVNRIKLQGIYIYSTRYFRPHHPPKNQQTIGSCSQSSWVGVWGRLQTRHVWKSKGMVFDTTPWWSLSSIYPPADHGVTSQDQRSKSLTSSQSFRKKVRPFFYAPWICFFPLPRVETNIKSIKSIYSILCHWYNWYGLNIPPSATWNAYYGE